MKSVTGEAIVLEGFLSNRILAIDYYQRGYKWKTKHIHELLQDLHDEFSNDWNPNKPNSSLESQNLYFLGSIVVIQSGETCYIVDGQQRITTIMLILIYLDNFLKDGQHKIDFKIKSLMYDEQPGENKYRLDIPDRIEFMKALMSENEHNFEEKSESSKNMSACYTDIGNFFSLHQLSENELHQFAWWIIKNVRLIQITVSDDKDAYTIFETMNDRGLPLSNTDMLRGYLLSNIKDKRQRRESENTIGNCIERLEAFGETTDSQFFKTLIRSQYEKLDSDTKKGEKFDDNNSSAANYHHWVRQNKSKILSELSSIYNFVNKDISFFAKLYIKLLNASARLTEDLRSVKFNNDINYTFQHQLIMAGISRDDKEDIVHEKINVIADFIDIWLNLRIWNHQPTRYDHTRRDTFKYITEIRRKPVDEIREILRGNLDEIMKKMTFSSDVRRNRYPSKKVFRIHLARLIDWLEIEAGQPGKYEIYTHGDNGQPPFNVEHILCADHNQFLKYFPESDDFHYHRNLIGALLLIPREENKELGDKPYEDKLDTYYRQNILASSLHRDFYNNNKKFIRTMRKQKIYFENYDTFLKKEIVARSELYSDIAKLVWNPDRVLKK